MKAPCRICEKPVSSHGLCHTHGERWRRWGRPPIEGWVAAFLEGRLNTCEVCNKPYNGYFRSKTCSPDCDKQRRRKSALARWYAKPEAERKRIAAARPTQRVERVGRVCEACQTTYIGLPNSKSCSAECSRVLKRMHYATSANKRRGATKLLDITIKLEGMCERGQTGNPDS